MLYDQTKHKDREHFCESCLYGFTREDLLNNHIFDCRGINQAAVAIEMPEPGEKIMFNNYRKQLKVPYIIYADFESIKAAFTEVLSMLVFCLVILQTIQVFYKCIVIFFTTCREEKIN